MSSMNKSRIGKRDNFIDKLIKDTSERTYRSKARKRYTPKVSRGGDTTPEYSRIEGYSSNLQSSEKQELGHFKTILSDFKDLPQPNFGDTKQTALSELEYLHQQRKIKLNPNYQPTKNGVHGDKLTQNHTGQPSDEQEVNYWNPPVVYPKYYEEVSPPISGSKGPVKAQALPHPEEKNEQNTDLKPVEQPMIEPVEETVELIENEPEPEPEVDEDPTPEPDHLPPQQIQKVSAFNETQIPPETVDQQIVPEAVEESPEVPTYHPHQEPVVETSKVEEIKQAAKEHIEPSKESARSKPKLVRNAPKSAHKPSQKASTRNYESSTISHNRRRSVAKSGRSIATNKSTDRLTE